MKPTSFLIFVSILLTACQPAVSENQTTEQVDVPGDQSHTINAVTETTPTKMDGANDPAIWVNADNLKNSLILGSAAANGIEIYSLDGERVGEMTDRPISLVDVIYDFPIADETTDLVVAFDTAEAALVIYTLDAATPSLQSALALPVELKTEIEGLCTYHSPINGKFYAFTAGGGNIQQWELYDNDGELGTRHTRTMPVGLGAAHCVADSASSALYYAQETTGVWTISAEPETDAEATAIELAQPFGRIAGDVKGISLIRFADGGYLLISDADESLFHAYDLNDDMAYAATFAIGSSEAADGVDEAEGMTAVGMSLSDRFPGGLVVINDDYNDGENTNYKLVSWGDISATAGLTTGTAFDPTIALAPTAVVVMPTVETDPVSSFGDAADDPAIWVHPTNPEMSMVFGTDKQLGLNTYDMNGKTIQALSSGRLNNVDIRYGFPLGDKMIDIATASNRTDDSISIYGIDPVSRQITDLADGTIDTGMIDPYGFCMYHNITSGDFYVFVNDTDGVVKQWLLKDAGNNRIGAELVRSFEVGSQTEGCVADDYTGDLYIGEENVAIWKYSADPDGGEDRVMVDSTTDGNLTSDVEGLALYLGPEGKGYLVASNQGADNYAIYERQGDNAFKGIFHVVADDATGIDGSSETDGLDVTSANLGPAFPHGALVVQDGRNIMPAERQNFKYIPWERVAEALDLEIYSGYDPRASGK